MADIKLLERMVADLRGRGMADMQIEGLRKVWPDFWLDPCPFCVLTLRAGILTRARGADGTQQMRCDTCGEIIRLDADRALRIVR